jgi:hypothetical protein
MTITADGAGLRADKGKARLDLIPPSWIFALAGPMTYGAVKYAERNWERGMKWTKIVGPLMRHLFKFLSGERCDPETGCHHLAHVAWNALALMTYDLRGIGENDLTMAESWSEYVQLSEMYNDPALVSEKIVLSNATITEARATQEEVDARRSHQEEVFASQEAIDPAVERAMHREFDAIAHDPEHAKQIEKEDQLAYLAHRTFVEMHTDTGAMKPVGECVQLIKNFMADRSVLG